MSSDLLTPFQLSEALSVNEQTIRRWYHAGTIPAVVAEGITLRFDLQEVRTVLIKRAAKRAKFRAVPTF